MTAIDCALDAAPRIIVTANRDASLQASPLMNDADARRCAL
jgi:hypothetical protein